jgi:hypothetical protein
MDFETAGQDTGWTVFANGANTNDTDFVRVPNPDKSGINTSDYCMRLTVAADADPWAGAYNNKITPFTISAANAMVTIMVYKDVTSRFDLKLEPPNVDHFDSNMVSGQWVQLTYDYTSDIGTESKTLTLIPDFPSTSRTAGSVTYIDNIHFGDNNVPVELVSFTASVVNNQVHLSWNTASEKNNSGFEVLRSTDSKLFTKIGFVHGNGTSSESKVYTYVDKNVSGTMYYKLKQIDFDGTYKYSKTVVASSSKPVEFSLSQNYPNPFNPTTTISYSIPTDNFVSLKVYNVLGNEVATLVNGQITSGAHNINFNASNLASGVYYYTIKTGNFTSTKKLMLLK